MRSLIFCRLSGFAEADGAIFQIQPIIMPCFSRGNLYIFDEFLKIKKYFLQKCNKTAFTYDYIYV